jgi:hypothetical protein
LACLSSNLSTDLPPTVALRGFKVPVKRIVEVFSGVLEYGPLIGALARQAGSAVTRGTLTLVQH